MKLRNLITIAAITGASLSVQAGTVDVSKSTVTWLGSKVVGSTHTGSIELKTADLKYKDNEPVSGNLVIDMTTIKNTDLKDAKWNAKLVKHLMSDDFFAVKKHKTAELKISKIEKASDKYYFVIGKLVIKGQSQPIKVKAEISKNNKKQQVVKAKFKFDRTKFGIKYGSGSFFENLGDKMISDEVEITVNLNINKAGTKLAAN